MPCIDSQRSLEGIDVLVLAGGRGTRISDVLGETPKLLASLAGRPFLDYLIDWLRRYGARKVTLSLGHLSAPVIHHLAERPYPDIEVDVVVEDRAMGTAGGVANARAHLASDPVLVLNGDSYTDVDLGAFVEFYRAQKFAAALVCVEAEDAGRFGRVEVGADGAIEKFVEKDEAFTGLGAISAGIYLIGSSLLDDIEALGEGSIENDIFAVQAPATLGGFSGKYDFIDFGTPDTFAQAQDFFANLAKPDSKNIG